MDDIDAFFDKKNKKRAKKKESKGQLTELERAELGLDDFGGIGVVVAHDEHAQPEETVAVAGSTGLGMTVAVDVYSEKTKEKNWGDVPLPTRPSADDPAAADIGVGEADKKKAGVARFVARGNSGATGALRGEGSPAAANVAELPTLEDVLRQEQEPRASPVAVVPPQRAGSNPSESGADGGDGEPASPETAAPASTGKYVPSARSSAGAFVPPAVDKSKSQPASLETAAPASTGKYVPSARSSAGAFVPPAVNKSKSLPASTGKYVPPSQRTA